MRLHNLTDVETPVLRAAGLVNTSIKVGKVVIAPGEFADLREVPADAGRYRKLEALYLGVNPPAKYSLAKAKPPEVPAKAPAVMSDLEKAPRATLPVETKVEVDDRVSTKRRNRQDE